MTFWIYVTGEEAREKEKDCQNWLSDRCQEINSGIRKGNSRTIFNTLKLMTRRQQRQEKPTNCVTKAADVLAKCLAGKL